MLRARSARLQAAVRVAQWREQRQRREWQQCEDICRQQQQSLSRLEQYREEYLVSAPERARVGVASLSNFSRFMRDLSQAISLQRQQLADSTRRAERSRMQWGQLYARQEAMQRLQREAFTVERRRTERRREYVQIPRRP